MVSCLLHAFRERAYGLQWQTDPILRWTKATVQEFCMQKPIMHQGKSFPKQLWFPFKSKIGNRRSRIILQKTQIIKSGWSAPALRSELSAVVLEFLKQPFFHIHFVWVIISSPFCPYENLLYFVYSAPSNMAVPVSWGASGGVKWHSLTPYSVLHSLVARFPHPQQAVSLDRKTSVP